MSDRDRPAGPVEIAGVTGRILRVGTRDVHAHLDAAVQNRAAGNLYEEYQATAEFAAALAASERQLKEDKRKLKEMTRWRRSAQRRAEREQELVTKYHAEQDGPGFPPPSTHVRNSP